jgi:hypothetical protein
VVRREDLQLHPVDTRAERLSDCKLKKHPTDTFRAILFPNTHAEAANMLHALERLGHDIAPADDLTRLDSHDVNATRGFDRRDECPSAINWETHRRRQKPPLTRDTIHKNCQASGIILSSISDIHDLSA